MDSEQGLEENTSRIVIAGVSAYAGDVAMFLLLLTGILIVPIGSVIGGISGAVEGAVDANQSFNPLDFINGFKQIRTAVGALVGGAAGAGAGVAAGFAIIASSFAIHYFAGAVTGGFLLPGSPAQALLKELKSGGVEKFKEVTGGIGLLLKHPEVVLWAAIILPLPLLSLGMWITVLLRSKLVKFLLAS